MVERNNTYSIFLFFCLTLHCCGVFSNNTFPDKSDHSLDIVEDTMNNVINIYLFQKLNIIDSIKISNVDFIISKLDRLDEKFWFFTFSKKMEGDSKRYRYQKAMYIVFTVLKNKIHFSLMGDFIYSYSPESIDKTSYSFKHEYCISQTDFIKKPTIIRNSFRVDYYNDSMYTENFEYEYLLNFDDKELVFYSELIESEGVYSFLEGNQEINFGINRIKSVDLGNYRYVYNDGKWYILSDYGYLISFEKEFDISR